MQANTFGREARLHEKAFDPILCYAYGAQILNKKNKNPVIGMREKVFNLRTTEEKFLIITSFYSVVYIMERSDGTQTACAPSV